MATAGNKDKPVRFEKALDEDTGETVLLATNAANVKIHGSNGTAVVDADAMKREVERLAERQRVREEERFLARLEADNAQTREAAQLKQRIAELEGQLKPAAGAEQQSLDASKENALSEVEKSTKGEKLENSQQQTETPKMDIDYAKFAELYAKKQQEDKEAVERESKLKEDEQKKQTAMAEIARAEFARLQAEASAKQQSNEEQQQPQGNEQKQQVSKRKAEKQAPKLDEEDDASLSDDEEDIADAEGGDAKRSKVFETDIQEIKKQFGEFADKAKKLREDKNRFLLNRNKVDEATAAKREKKFAVREERLEKHKNALLDWAAGKLMQYEKDTKGAVASNYESMIADLKARTNVNAQDTQTLQATVEAAASTAREFGKRQQTLTDLEKKLQDMRRVNAENEIKLKRAEMGLSAQFEASRSDPAAHKKAIAGAAAAMNSSGMQNTNTDNVADMKRASYIAYATPQQFVATASSQSKGAEGVDYEDTNKKLPMWVQKRADVRRIPKTHARWGNLGYGPIGSKASLHPVRPMEEGMAYSDDPRHQSVLKRLCAERDYTAVKGAALPMVMPGDYAEEEGSSRTAISTADFYSNAVSR